MMVMRSESRALFLLNKSAKQGRRSGGRSCGGWISEASASEEQIMKRVVGVVMFAAVLAVAQVAQAAVIQMRLTSGVSTVTIDDNGAGDLNGGTGTIVFMGAVGGWSLNVSTGLGSDGAAVPGYMDLNDLSQTNSSSSLVIEFTQTGNTVIFPGWQMNWSWSITGNGGPSSVMYQAFVDDLDALYGTTQTIGTLGPYFGPGGFNMASGPLGGAAITGTYSLTQRITINSVTTGSLVTYSGNAELIPVPEPGSMLLLGTGLLAIGGALRRRARR
jgi:hypothetical protein